MSRAFYLYLPASVIASGQLQSLFVAHDAFFHAQSGLQKAKRGMRPPLRDPAPHLPYRFIVKLGLSGGSCTQLTALPKRSQKEATLLSSLTKSKSFLLPITVLHEQHSTTSSKKRKSLSTFNLY
jgi:hypothetical protein